MAYNNEGIKPELLIEIRLFHMKFVFFVNMQSTSNIFLLWRTRPPVNYNIHIPYPEGKLTEIENVKREKKTHQRI